MINFVLSKMGKALEGNTKRFTHLDNARILPLGSGEWEIWQVAKSIYLEISRYRIPNIRPTHTHAPNSLVTRNSVNITHLSEPN